MENPNAPQKLNAWTGMTPEGRKKVKTIIGVIFIVALAIGAWQFGWIPGLKSSKSMDISKYTSENGVVSSTMGAEMLPVPNAADAEFAEMDSIPVTKLIHWIWFGNAPIFTANGGSKTVKGSIMETYGVNLQMEMNNSVTYMKDQQLAFIKELADGNARPTTGAPIVTLMGDGVPAYISAMNHNITKAYGEEYNLKAFGIVAFSMGEDCGMGYPEFAENPQLLKGAVCSAVIGDGDWALLVRYAADNGILVNPDANSWDKNALNFVPAPDDDFLKAADDMIAGREVELKVKDENGRLGATKTFKIGLCATWFPGDRNLVKNTNALKIISTIEYPNQMATTLVAPDKWLKQNSKTAVALLSAALTAGNQIKSYPEWFDYACQLAPKVFYPNGDPSETYEDWLNYAKPKGTALKNIDGVPVLVGGTQMASLNDAKKYYGLKGGNSIYKSVYDYFGKILEDLNPCDIMGNVDKITTYEEAVDVTYLQKVNLTGNAAGVNKAYDYSKNTDKVFAKRAWKIEFALGSAELTPASKVLLKDVYDQIMIAGNATVGINGHTDNTGTPEGNDDLSLARAKSVKAYLIELSDDSFPAERFKVKGLGQNQPVELNVDNNANWARKQNRRVEILLMQ